MVIIKYMGSKARISKDLIPIINNIIKQKEVNTYIEPFVGGANMIDKVKCEKKVGVDKHKYLISFLNAVKNGYKPPEKIDVEHYYDVKESFKKEDNKYEDYYYGAIGFLGAFRGLFFDSQGCKDYISQGRVRNNYIESRKNVLNQVKNLKDVELIHNDYQNIKVSDNSLVYCDPPYQDTSQKGYADKDQFDYDYYWNWVRELSKNNIVLCSEYNAPDDFVCIWQKEVSTNLSVQNRKKDIEKLFIHKSRYLDIKDIVKN